MERNPVVFALEYGLAVAALVLVLEILDPLDITEPRCPVCGDTNCRPVPTNTGNAALDEAWQKAGR
jgi:hypothetical protein